MTATTTTASSLRIQLEGAENAHDAALQALDDARAKLEEERTRPQAPEPEADSPAPDIQPARWTRIARAEFEIDRAKHRARDAEAELDRVRALLVAAERRDSAAALAKYERAAAEEEEIDQKLNGVFRAAFEQARATLPEARRAANAKAALFESLPLDVRAAVTHARSSWAAFGTEEHLSRVEKQIVRTS